VIINQIYEGFSESALAGKHRLLWFDDDLAILIPIPLDGQSVAKYVTGPKEVPTCALRAALSSGDFFPSRIQLPGVFTMTDAQIQKRYANGTSSQCKQLEVRDDWFEAIKPLLDDIDASPAAFYSDPERGTKTATAQKRSPLGKFKFYNGIHRCMALGAGKNSLLPFYFRCGAPGKERILTQKPGRPDAAFAAGLAESKGLVLEDDDKENLAWGYRVYMDGTRSDEEAFALTSALFWSEGTHVVNGEELPKLLPSRKRPTIHQFRRWGLRALDNETAFKLIVGENDFENNFRAITGSVLDGVHMGGLIGSADATSGDVHLTALSSRLQSIGAPVRLFMHDLFTSMICGINCSLDAPSEQMALSTVLNAALSKVDLCRRYGIEIEENDIPPMFFSKIFVDNGEYRTNNSIRTVAGLGGALELITVGKSSKNSTSESGHRSFHKMTSHKIHGTTKGRPRKRGEDLAATKACWNFYENMRLLLQGVKYYNCEQRVEAFMDAHPYCTAMKADGVPPIRKAIYEWGLQKGLIRKPGIDEAVLRAALLPTIKGVVRSNGVFLLRPDVGRRRVIIKGPRFLGPRVAELGWREKVRRSRPFTIELKYDENDLTQVWYADELGFHRFENVSNDLLLVQKGTLADAIAMQESDVVERNLDLDRANQAHSDFVVSRETNNDHYYRLKQEEIAQSPDKVTKKQLASGVKEHRQAEKNRMSAKTATAECEESVPRDETPSVANQDWMDTALEAHRRG
jgi:hypothetical protein